MILKREDPTLALDRLQVWLAEDGNRSCEVTVRADSRYSVYLGVLRGGAPETLPSLTYTRHIGDGETLGAAIEDALNCAARGIWRRA